MSLCARLVCLALTIPSVSSAWEQSLSDQGQPLSWPTNCVVFHLNEEASEDVTAEKAHAAIRAAFQTWSEVPGAYLTFVDGGLTNINFGGRGGNPRNAVYFVENELDWVDVDSDILSYSTVTYDPKTGAILDADIAMNGAWFEFTTDDDVVDWDIRASVLHEIGHLVGLEDSQEPGAVMHQTPLRGDLSGRQLGEDDKAGLAALYPSASDPGVCDDSTAGDFYLSALPSRPSAGAADTSSREGAAVACTAASGGGGEPAVPLLLLAMLLAVVGRSRGILLASGFLLLASPAGAYTLYQSPDDDSIPLRWYTVAATLTFDETSPDAVDAEVSRGRVVEAFVAWSALACDATASPFRFIFGEVLSGGAVGYSEGAGAINENLVTWVGDTSSWAHANDVLALTTLTYDRATGEIYDADMELNEAHFAFSDAADDTQADVLNTVVHEAGHFLGLDHSDLTSSTMFKRSPLGEISKRDLMADDIAGYCALYGPDAPPQIVIEPPAGTPSCSANGPRGAVPDGLFWVFAAVLAARRLSAS